MGIIDDKREGEERRREDNVRKVKTRKGTVSGGLRALLNDQFLKNELGSINFSLALVNSIEARACSTIRAIPLPSHLCKTIAIRVSFDPA